MMERVILFSLLISFLITVLLSPIFIPFLRRLKFGQSIREEGPKSHQKKSGTPTMGGILIVISILITTLIMMWKFSQPSWEIYLLLFVTLGYGLLGFLDDFIKIAFKRNLGLTSKQKLIGQIVIAIIFYIVLRTNEISTVITIPMTDFGLDLGWFYAVFIVFWLVGFSNAVNLTEWFRWLTVWNSRYRFWSFCYCGMESITI